MDRHDPQEPLDRQLLARFLAAVDEESRDAEGAGSDFGSAAAEAALTALLVGLPRPLPRPGFAERAALAAAITSPRARAAERAVAPRWRWLLLAACLVATGLGVALLPFVLGVARLAAGRVSFAGAAALPVRLATLAASGLAAAAADLSSLWQRLASPVLGLQHALAIAVARPGSAAVAALCLLISALALRFLHDLVERERSWNHVHPNR